MNGTCYFCGEHEKLEEHHIVPQRFDGSDSEENLVNLCPTCHSKIESLYDKRFYDQLGVSKDGQEFDRQCDSGDCTAQAYERMDAGEYWWYLCEAHYECDYHDCSNKPTIVATGNDHIVVCCDDHGRCVYGNCKSTDVNLVDLGYRGEKIVCDQHMEILSDD